MTCNRYGNLIEPNVLKPMFDGLDGTFHYGRRATDGTIVFSDGLNVAVHRPLARCIWGKTPKHHAWKIRHGWSNLPAHAWMVDTANHVPARLA